MLDGLVDVVRDLASSPWVYLGLFVIAAVDGFFPLVPSESAVVTVGVFAATGEPALAPVIAAAAAGAIAGDHVSYALGRAAGPRLVGSQRSRRRSAMAWAKRVLAQRGGLVIVVARYVPGGRVAATMTAGSVGYPLRRFTPFATIAGLSWGAYSALVGFLGGSAFEDDPVRGLLLGFSLAMLAALVVEGARHLLRRRSRSRTQLGATTDQASVVAPTEAPSSSAPMPASSPSSDSCTMSE